MDASINFKRLPASRTPQGIKRAAGTGTPRGPNGPRKPNPFDNLRMSVRADVLRAIGYAV